MRDVLAWLIFGTVASCSSTGGTETGNPASLEHFSASDCKNDSPAPGQQALVLASELEGLQCVEWARDASGQLDVRLFNFPEPCGDTYLGRAALATDGALELSVYKDRCEVLKCGNCLFDFEFRVRGVALDTPLEVRAGSALCESRPATFDENIRLAVDAEDSGLTCRYLRRNVLEQLSSTRDSCGRRNMPCGCTAIDADDCAEGLTCTEVADADRRCLTSCETDADCGGATECRDGACQADFDW